jgi:acyl-CoA thioester hydrolase
VPTAQPFCWPVRVYYEDTDAAGIVYYANYLKFMERARTEWLGAQGLALAALESEYHAVFVVHRVDIEYRQPARLGDALGVTMTPLERGRSRLVVAQDVLRDGELLARARVTLALVDRRTWRLMRMPAPLQACLEIAA